MSSQSLQESQADCKRIARQGPGTAGLDLICCALQELICSHWNALQVNVCFAQISNQISSSVLLKGKQFLIQLT